LGALSLALADVTGLVTPPGGTNAGALGGGQIYITGTTQYFWSRLGGNSNAYSSLSYQPGLLTSIVSTKSVYSKVAASSTVDNIIGSAQSLTTCTTNPTITMYECGTDATCAAPTTIGSATITATGQAFTGTVSNAAVAAGDYVGWAISAGACASLDIGATAQVHTN